MYQLPHPLFSWAWSSTYLAKAAEARPDGLLLPPAATQPAYVHFSKLTAEGEQSWLWLFPNPQEAIALRTLQVTPGLSTDPLAELVGITIPRSLPDCQNPTFVQLADTTHLRDLPLLELGIQQVWIGFDYHKYAATRVPQLALAAQLESDEFCAIARR